MTRLPKKPQLWLVPLIASFIGLGLLIAAFWGWRFVRPQPSEKEQVLFPGVRYQRLVRKKPHPMVIHLVTIDLRQEGISFLVTPGDPKAELPLKARTTSGFLEEFDLQLAINGDGFVPWHSNSLLDYYPKNGDPVNPLGFAASKGVVYSANPLEHPILYIGRNNTARFNSAPGQIYNAISGSPILVLQGNPAVGGKDNANNSAGDAPAESNQPRTAIGLDKNNRKLILVVIDGRQPGYSQGATLSELAEIMVAAGAFTAMNLDGGGSSTLVKAANNGRAVVLNSPIDNHIPGRERNVGNHLGVYAAR